MTFVEKTAQTQFDILQKKKDYIDTAHKICIKNTDYRSN